MRNRRTTCETRARTVRGCACACVSVPRYRRPRREATTGRVNTRLAATIKPQSLAVRTHSCSLSPPPPPCPPLPRPGLGLTLALALHRLRLLLLLLSLAFFLWHCQCRRDPFTVYPRSSSSPYIFSSFCPFLLCFFIISLSFSFFLPLFSFLQFTFYFLSFLLPFFIYLSTHLSIHLST